MGFEPTAYACAKHRTSAVLSSRRCAPSLQAKGAIKLNPGERNRTALQLDAAAKKNEKPQLSDAPAQSEGERRETGIQGPDIYWHLRKESGDLAATCSGSRVRSRSFLSENPTR